MNLKPYVALAVSLMVLQGCSQKGMVGKGSGVEIDGTPSVMYRLEKPAEAYDVYHAEDQGKHASARLERYAALLGVTGERRETADTLKIEGAKHSVLVDKRTGSVRFWLEAGSGGAPDEGAGLGVAQGFIKRLQLGSGTPTFQNTMTRKKASLDLKTGASSEEVEQRDYMFRRVINGHAVYGLGSMAIVSVGKGGRVTGGYIDWPELTFKRKVGLKDSGAAFRDLDGALGRINSQLQTGRRLVRMAPRDVKVRYLAQPAEDGGLDVRPAYAFVGETTRQDGSVTPDNAVFVTASDEAPLSTRVPAEEPVTPPEPLKGP